MTSRSTCPTRTRSGLRIERVIETHFHADFLSGHLELAAATGAVISYGDEARADFPIDGLAHGQRLSLGDVTLEIRHTPGHTPESISIVVWEHAERSVAPWAVLTGDTLFIGDVGRPDLLTSIGWTADDLARRLYRSVRDQLLSLPDATRVYPAHGAGSACGKNLSAAVESTIGEQRRTNYALAPMTEDEFVEAVTQGQSVAPLYFAFAANANRAERELLDDAEETPRLDIDQALHHQAEGAVMIDGRPAELFASGHLRGSINVGLDGRFAEYAGDVLRPGEAVIVITDPGRENEARIRLARIGFDHVLGALSDIGQVLTTRPDLAEQAPGSRPPSWRVAPRGSVAADRRRAQPRRMCRRDRRRIPEPATPDPARPAPPTRPGTAHRRLLRRRLPVRHRRIAAPLPRLHNGCGPARGLRGQHRHIPRGNLSPTTWRRRSSTGHAGADRGQFEDLGSAPRQWPR